ncbi:hypothetical protein SEVIR_3G340700v4 [Setaria viridis]|uniref:uncharacterized protein isoform X2 n=1 Tax=Setaria viridis TaxID=4556 RepID=UPI001493C8BA|nr:factor of DNA methylation 1-like isoform X3 [Setaria viridis]
MAEDTGTNGLLGAMASKVDFKLSLLKDAMAEYSEIKHVIDGVVKEKERLQQEKERLQNEEEMLRREQHANGEAMAAMKEDLLASQNTLTAARDALVSSTEEISLKNNYIEFLKKKLEKSEAKNNQAEQQCGSVMDPIQPKGVLKGPMEKQKRLSERLQGNDAVNIALTKECPRKELVDKPPVGQTSCVLVSEEDLEAVRDELIKGFLEIDIGGRKIGIKEMGELNEKAFKAACLAKLPPEEVGTASHELYSSWQQQLGDLSWYPFKTVTVDGNQQEIVNVDDEKLQELKRAWGSGAHNAVVNALVEMKGYGRLSDRSIAYELWNYKEGRRATTTECVSYMSNQVKQLSVTKRRKIRRSSGRA